MPLFSARRAADAKALVDISRGFDGGFLTFVLPLILDGMFHRAFPSVFMPNTIQMLQKKTGPFSRVARRKRAERVAQVAILSTLLAAVAWLVGKAAKAAFGAMRAHGGAAAGAREERQKDTTKKRLLDRHEKRKQPTNSPRSKRRCSRGSSRSCTCEKVEPFTVFQD